MFETWGDSLILRAIVESDQKIIRILFATLSQAYLSVDWFPRCYRLLTRILTMFGRTYLCEQLFPLMKNNKNFLKVKINRSA
jgi:hypothetical protein